MPCFSLGGVLVYFAAFKNHIGVYPPVPASLKKETAPYAGEKGNLKFPLDTPIPYTLIVRIVTIGSPSSNAADCTPGPSSWRCPRAAAHR